MQNFENLWEGVWDHGESENINLHAIWTLLMVEIIISRYLPALAIASVAHSTTSVRVHCTIVSVHVQ